MIMFPNMKPAYQIIVLRHPQLTGRGGAVALLYKESINCASIDLGLSSSFKALVCA